MTNAKGWKFGGAYLVQKQDQAHQYLPIRTRLFSQPYPGVSQARQEHQAGRDL